MVRLFRLPQFFVPSHADVEAPAAQEEVEAEVEAEVVEGDACGRTFQSPSGM